MSRLNYMWVCLCSKQFPHGWFGMHVLVVRFYGTPSNAPLHVECQFSEVHASVRLGALSLLLFCPIVCPLSYAHCCCFSLFYMLYFLFHSQILLFFSCYVQFCHLCHAFVVADMLHYYIQDNKCGVTSYVTNTGTIKIHL